MQVSDTGWQCDSFNFHLESDICILGGNAIHSLVVKPGLPQRGASEDVEHVARSASREDDGGESNVAFENPCVALHTHNEVSAALKSLGVLDCDQ